LTLDEAQALFSRALALEDQGRPADALAVYRQLLARDAQHADARHNFGLLLARLGRLEEAEQSHRKYVQSHPQSARARNDLADVLLARGDFEGVVAATEGISQPDASMLVRRGVGLSCLGRFAEARHAFSQALSLSDAEVRRFAERIGGPGSDPATMLSPENIFVGRHFLAQKACDWSGWDGRLERVRGIYRDPHAVLEPAAGYMPLLFPFSGKERLQAAAQVAARIEAGNPPLPPSPQRRKGARIRIGVLSPDFREHVNSYLLLPLFELLDRSDFEILACSLLPPDGSLIGNRIRAAADALVELHGTSDAEAAARIRADDVDILLDVAGHTTGGRFGIVARRPARVQAAYMGFLGSLGSKRIDFAIVDEVIAPTTSEWAENLVRLPHTFFLYDFREPPKKTRVTRREYGLPDDAFVYCAFHQESKITPDTFALWMEVLRAVPRAVLWVRALPEPGPVNLKSAAAAQQVDPARLVFAPFEPRIGGRYFGRHDLGDVLLDALHHNAVTSACDALAAGLPLVTVRGEAPAARAAESMVRAAGLPELVAADRAAFVELAIALGTQPDRLRRVREKLAANRGSAPLFDTPARVRELESGFRRMMEDAA
jgi:protein O-GlcNAc transferase